MICDVQHLAAGLSGHSGPRVFDVRFDLIDTEWGRNAYQQAHIPGAIYLHLDSDLSSDIIPGVTGRHPLPEKQNLEQLLRSVGLRQQDRVVIYDQGHGGIAARLWWLLKWAGHDDVSVLNGGWSAWQEAGMNVESAVPSFGQSDYQAAFRDELTVSRDTVGVSDLSFTLVDSRDSQRYHGVIEPIDPIAGHIPGAINLPFKENLDESGMWKSPQQLRTRFEELSAEPVFYCGSGVTACHNILAYSLAGLGEARLYPGSWSEWITDPEAPIVVSQSEQSEDD